jgi:hypothetical protein
MSIQKHLDTAFDAIFALQNDETAVHSRDSQWDLDRADKLATAQQAIVAARAELPVADTSPAEDYDSETQTTVTDNDGKTHETFES